MCRACGALNVVDDEIWNAARTQDEPTEVMPAVAPEDAVEDSDGTSRRPELEPSAPVVESPAVFAPTSESPIIIEPPARRRLSGSRRELVLGGVFGAAAVIAIIIGSFATAGIIGNLFAAPGSTEVASAEGSPTPSPLTELAPAAEIGGASCSPRQLAAPAAGRWQLYRAEFGQRGGFDYLRFKLRRDGNHEESARLTAELLAPDEVVSRYGIEAPSDADVALVVAFEGPVAIGSSWGANPRYGALREFRVTRAGNGNVHAVLALAGDGCFSLSGGGWESGELSSPTDITLEIQKG